MHLLEEVMQHGLDHDVNQSQAKGVKKYTKSSLNDQISSQSDAQQI